MTRSSRAGKGLVKRAFAGKGEYEVRHPGAGQHLEAPLSKQVLVFAKGDKAKSRSTRSPRASPRPRP